MAKNDDFMSEEWDFDDEFNFDEIDAEPGQVKDDRSPATKVAYGVFKGAKDHVLEPTTVKKFIKDSLPRQYGSTTNLVETGANLGAQIYSDIDKELRPALQETARFARKVAPSLSTYMPASLAEKFNELADGKQKSSGPSKEEMLENSIQASLTDIFSKQAQAQDEIRREDKEGEKVRELVDAKRHKEGMDVWGQMSRNIARLAEYQDNVTVNWQRKTLELQMRQYHLQVDQFEEAKRINAIMQTNLEGILKNTALPEYQKITKLEAAGENWRNRGINAISDRLFGDKSNFFGKLSTEIRKNTLAKIKELKDQWVDALEMGSQLADTLESQREMGGDATEMVTGMIGGNLMQRVLTRMSMKARDYANRNNWVRNTGHNLSEGIQRLPNRLVNWAKEGHTKSGFLGAGLDIAQASILGVGKTDHRINNSYGDDLNGAAIVDKRLHRSVTEVIPGYLARILRQTQINSEYALAGIQYEGRRQEAISAASAINLTLYDYSSGKFVDKNKIVNRIRNKIFDQERAKQNASRIHNFLDFAMEEIRDNDEVEAGDRVNLSDEDKTVISRILQDMQFKGIDIHPVAAQSEYFWKEKAGLNKRQKNYIPKLIRFFQQSMGKVDQKYIEQYEASDDDEQKSLLTRLKDFGKAVGKGKGYNRNMAKRFQDLMSSTTDWTVNREAIQDFGDTYGFQMLREAGIVDKNFNINTTAQRNFISSKETMQYRSDLVDSERRENIKIEDAINNNRFLKVMFETAQQYMDTNKKVKKDSIPHLWNDPTFRRAASNAATNNFDLLKRLCDHIGIPLRVNKDGKYSNKGNYAGGGVADGPTHYANGGRAVHRKKRRGVYTGPGAKWEEVDVKVHAGEIIFSQQDIDDLGGVDVVEYIRKNGVQGLRKAYNDLNLHKGDKFAKKREDEKNKKLGDKSKLTLHDMVWDIRKSILEGKLGMTIGMIDPEQLPWFMQSIGNTIGGAANKLWKGAVDVFDWTKETSEKGVSNIWKLAKDTSKWMKESYYGLKGQAKERILSIKSEYANKFDVWVQGDHQAARLYRTLLDMGRYYKSDGKTQLRSWKDIDEKGVWAYDDDGNFYCVMNPEEVKKAFVINYNTGKTVLLDSIATAIDWSKTTLGNVKDRINAAHSFTMDLGRSLIDKAKSTLYLPQDVYVKGKTDEGPRLFKVTMKAGKYRLKSDPKKIIEHPGDITGEVIDETGNIVITKQDLKDGLVDRYGNKLRVGVDKLVSLGIDLVGLGVSATAEMGKWIWNRAVDSKKGLASAFGGVRSFFAQFFGDGGLIFANSNKMLDSIDRIYKLLDERIPDTNLTAKQKADEARKARNKLDKLRKAEERLREEAEAKNMRNRTTTDTGKRLLKTLLAKFGIGDEDANTSKGGLLEDLKDKAGSVFDSVLGGDDINVEGDYDRRGSRTRKEQKARDRKAKALRRERNRDRSIRDRTAAYEERKKNRFTGMREVLDEQKRAGRKIPAGKGEKLKGLLGDAYQAGRDSVLNGKDRVLNTKDKVANRWERRPRMLGGLGKEAAGKPSLLSRMMPKYRGGGLISRSFGAARGLMGGMVVGGALGIGGLAARSMGYDGLAQGLDMAATVANGYATVSMVAGMLGFQMPSMLGLAGGALKGIMGLASAAASGLGGTLLAALPWVAAAAAVGALGYHYWKASDNKKIRELGTFRYKQYGFPADDNGWTGTRKWVTMLREAEAFFEENKLIKFEAGKARIEDEKLDDKKAKEFLDIFDATDSEEQMKYWGEWYLKRFKPLYEAWLTHLETIKPGTKLIDIDEKLSKEEKKKLLAAVRFPGMQYVIVPPTPDLKQCLSTEQVNQAYDETLAKIEKLPDGVTSKGDITPVVGATATTIGMVSHLSMTKGNVATERSVREYNESIATGDVEKAKALRKDLTKNISGMTGNMAQAAAAAGVATVIVSDYSGQVFTGKALDTITAIRYKAYGLTDMESSRVDIMRSLEQALLKSITLTADRKAKFNADLEQFAIRQAAAVGINEKDTNGIHNFRVYLERRMIPVLLNAITAVAANSTKTTPTTMLGEQESAHIKEKVAAAMISARHADGSVWNIKEGLWKGYALNTDSATVEGYLNTIRKDIGTKSVDAKTSKEMAETANLTQQQRTEKMKIEEQKSSTSSKTGNTSTQPEQKGFWQGTKEWIRQNVMGLNADGTAPGTTLSDGGTANVSKDVKARMKQIYQSFVNAGFSHNQALALTGEVGRENDYVPRNLFGSHGDLNNGATNIGFISWQGKRKENLINFMKQRGIPITQHGFEQSQRSLDAMAAFLKYEITGGDPYETKRAKEFVSNPNGDVESLAYQLSKNVIRFDIDGKGKLGASGARIAVAKRNRYINTLKGLVGNTGPSTPTDMAGSTPIVNTKAEYDKAVAANKPKVTAHPVGIAKPGAANTTKPVVGAPSIPTAAATKAKATAPKVPLKSAANTPIVNTKAEYEKQVNSNSPTVVDSSAQNTGTPWMDKAHSLVGVNERDHDSLIRDMHKVCHLKAGGKTPWCASFVSYILESVGIPSTKNAAAISYASYGNAAPPGTYPYGAILVFKMKRGNHVSFCAGTEGDRVLSLGGNQSSKAKGDQRNGGEVTISRIPMSQVIAVRLPVGYTGGANGGTEGLAGSMGAAAGVAVGAMSAEELNKFLFGKFNVTDSKGDSIFGNPATTKDLVKQKTEKDAKGNVSSKEFQKVADDGKKTDKTGKTDEKQKSAYSKTELRKAKGGYANGDVQKQENVDKISKENAAKQAALNAPLPMHDTSKSSSLDIRKAEFGKGTLFENYQMMTNPTNYAVANRQAQAELQKRELGKQQDNTNGILNKQLKEQELTNKLLTSILNVVTDKKTQSTVTEAPVKEELKPTQREELRRVANSRQTQGQAPKGNLNVAKRAFG